MKTTIRTARVEDAEGILKIYGPYIKETAITFEYDVPTVEEFQGRISKTLKKYPYLVAEDETGIVGYAYAGPMKERSAFFRSVETSIYLRKDQHGKGLGRILYSELEKALKDMNIAYLTASIAWIDEEDEHLTHNSPKFHAAMGWTKCAHFHKCGYKFDKWYDLIWMEKRID